MADFVSMLVDMGFDRDKSIKAVEKTGNRGVEPAMEWMLANPDEPSGSGSGSGSNGNAAAAAEGTSTSTNIPEDGTVEDAVPKSYKCDDCGKLFTCMEQVELHVARTSHQNFSESTEEKKPLSEEEKKEQQEKLLQILSQKRKEREEREKKDAIDSEKRRMATGKELAEAKRRLQDQEMKQIAEQRRREKIEDRQAREKIKAQIEEDKLARKQKFGIGGGEGGSEQSPAPTAAPTTPTSSKASEPEVVAVKKDYTETKLQIRLPNGKTMTQTFGVGEPLAAVRVFIELNRDDGGSEAFNLMTNFPRKIFEPEDYEKPLNVLGLIPSAVLMVTRKA